MKTPLALLLVALAGVAAALQTLVNGELGQRVDSAALAGVANNVTGSVLIVLGIALLPSIRTGLVALRRARLPWWAYLGGLGGGFFVALSAYAVPSLGVAVFTIAQVTGASLGGLAVDRTGLAPVGRLPVSGPRLVGTAVCIGAVSLAQLGRPVGNLALGLVALSVACGVAIALQAALNGRLAVVGTPGAATVVNFAVSSPVLIGLAAATGGFGSDWPDTWPSEWWLYLGGPLGVTVVGLTVVAVRVIGVLRLNLALVAGQLSGALVLDSVFPTGVRPSLAVAAGALLTMVAVAVTGWQRAGSSRAAADPPGPGPRDGREDGPRAGRTEAARDGQEDGPRAGREDGPRAGRTEAARDGQAEAEAAGDGRGEAPEPR